MLERMITEEERSPASSTALDPSLGAAEAPPVLSDEELRFRTEQAWALVGRAQREALDLLREVARREAWRDQGAESMVHWVAIRFGVSLWKAERFVASAHALDQLPQASAALDSGLLGLDQVLELSRFATEETEGHLIGWASVRSPGSIRHRANLERRRHAEEVRAVERDRFLRSGYSDDGSRFELEAELPADQGAIVEKALSRLADRMPADPDDEERAYPREVGCADALVQLCSGRLSADPDVDRATLVVHVPAEALADRSGASAANAEVESGPVLTPAAAQRLACDARVQAQIDDTHGNPLALGRLTRVPSAQLVRALRSRDRTCRFPGCDRRRFTNAHHVRWWARGGRTDIDNLVLLCSFHHRLVHEGGWTIRRDRDATVEWFRPMGERYRTGPAPPVELLE